MAIMGKQYDRALEETMSLARQTEGLLKDSEIKLLFFLSSFPTAKGEVLEIGSYKGRSTITLARGMELAGEGRVVAVDPLTLPSETDPELVAEENYLSAFVGNLTRAGVRERVEFHRMLSSELARSWNRAIRLLWIDGDHTYSGAKQDYEIFSPFLSEGAMVAFHDVMHRFEGPIRVFTEDVLPSDRFGAAGITGSIGWAQYLGDETEGSRYKGLREKLRKRLRRLMPYQANRTERLGYVRKRLYRLHRSLVPKCEPVPERLLDGLICSSYRP